SEAADLECVAGRYASPQPRRREYAVLARLEVDRLPVRVLDRNPVRRGYDVELAADAGPADRVGHRPLDEHHLVPGVARGGHEVDEVRGTFELAPTDLRRGDHPGTPFIGRWLLPTCGEAARSAGGAAPEGL